MKKRDIILLFTITIFACFLRFYKITRIPHAVSWDEAAIGYNAYSIVQTGKDEYGNAFPRVFRSFDDYKLPGYVYLTALSEKVFGFSDFAVRFPSAFLGTFTVLITYFLVRELFNKTPRSRVYSLLAAFLFAISPWHLQFSRAGFEANASLFFLVLGMFLLLKGRTYRIHLLLSLPVLIFSLYFYYTVRILVPVLLIAVPFLYRREFFTNIRWFLASCLLAVFVLIPIVPVFFGENVGRINTVSIFNDPETASDHIIALSRSPENLFARIVYNRRIAYARKFLSNFFLNNSIDFLFISGDPYPRHHISGMGMLYLWELPFFLYGIYVLIKKRTKEGIVLFVWWATGAVPASLTNGAPNALRTLTTLPVFIMFTVLGLVGVYRLFVKKSRLLFQRFLAVVIGVFFITYIFYYYDFTPPHTAAFWGDGHKQLFTRLDEIKSDYDTIHITGANYKPYIYALYYLKYPPDEYLKEKGSPSGFDTFVFYEAEWAENGKTLPERIDTIRAKDNNDLFVLAKNEEQEDLLTLGSITDTYNKPVFVLQKPK